MDFENFDFDYLSTFTLDEKTYTEFRQINYRQSLVAIIIIWGIYLISTITQLLIPECDGINIIYPICVALFYTFRYIFAGASIKSSYRYISSANNDKPIKYITIFGKCIMECTTRPLPNLYDYADVAYIMQSDNLYILSLRRNVYVLAEKHVINQKYYFDFLDYMFDKCTRIRSFGIFNINKFKTIHLGMTIFSIVCLIAILIVNIIF